MKNKLFMLLMIVFVIVTAAGCGKDEEDPVHSIEVERIEESDLENDAGSADNGVGKENTGETVDATGEETTKEDLTAVKGEAVKAAEPQKTEEGDKAALQADPEKTAYYAVLEKLYKTYMLPDGTELGCNDVSNLSWNKFAIYDIDQDGKEELIILWTNTIMAGMVGIVYGYDSASDTVRTELLDFPAQAFYDNGVVRVESSHNHGLAGNIDDFWPHTLYRYDCNSDAYAVIAEVDAWNKAYYELDYDGKPFPDELDVDGDGIMYRVTTGGNEELMDLEAYKKWQESIIGEAKKVEIPFVEMTEESIQGKY